MLVSVVLDGFFRIVVFNHGAMMRTAIAGASSIGDGFG
jgi:hypothetical protein